MQRGAVWPFNRSCGAPPFRVKFVPRDADPRFMIKVAAPGEPLGMYTAYLPAERAQPGEVERQHRVLAGLPFVCDFLDAMPNMAVVLNAERQIVLANRAFTAYLRRAGDDAPTREERQDAGDAALDSVIGRRTGEAVGCVRAHDTEGGCGTTPFCRNCGSAHAILHSQQWHALDVQECRMIGGELGVCELPLDFRVWAQPIQVEGETYTVFSLMDISHEKRREALERIFFHDVMNTAGGVKGLADLMATARLPESAIREAAGMVAESADHLIEEINAQRALSAAESGDLAVNPSEAASDALIDRVIHACHAISSSHDRDIRVQDTGETFTFVTDPVLLRRVLVNLVKNALEAEPAGGVVTIGAHDEGDTVSFTVHNTRAMPNEVQLQVFQRSFSTKGSGRGLGTYSIKLLTERYLNGRAGFTSNDDDGTTFCLRFPRDVATGHVAR